MYKWLIFKHKKDPKPMDNLGAPISGWAHIEPDTYYRRIGDRLYVETTTGRVDVSKIAPPDYHWAFLEISRTSVEHRPGGVVKQFTLVFVLTPNKTPLTLESLAERVLKLEAASVEAPTFSNSSENSVQYAYVTNDFKPHFGVEGTKTNYKSIELQVQDKCGLWRSVHSVFKSQTYRIAFHK